MKLSFLSLFLGPFLHDIYVKNRNHFVLMYYNFIGDQSIDQPTTFLIVCICVYKRKMWESKLTKIKSLGYCKRMVIYFFYSF